MRRLKRNAASITGRLIRKWRRHVGGLLCSRLGSICPNSNILSPFFVFHLLFVVRSFK